MNKIKIERLFLQSDCWTRCGGFSTFHRPEKSIFIRLSEELPVIFYKDEKKKVVAFKKEHPRAVSAFLKMDANSYILYLENKFLKNLSFQDKVTGKAEFAFWK